MLTWLLRKGSLLLAPPWRSASFAQMPETKGVFGKKSGQAAVEYILLVAFISLIFGVLFTSIRQNLFNLWVCEMAPRIQSPVPCDNGATCLDHTADIQTRNFCY